MGKWLKDIEPSDFRDWAIENPEGLAELWFDWGLRDLVNDRPWAKGAELEDFIGFYLLDKDILTELWHIGGVRDIIWEAEGDDFFGTEGFDKRYG